MVRANNEAGGPRKTIRCVRLDRGESGAKKVLPHWMRLLIRKDFLSALYFYQEEESYPDSYGCLKQRSKENRNNKRRETSSFREELVINWSVKVPKSKQGVGCSILFFFIDWNLLNKIFVYIQLS